MKEPFEALPRDLPGGGKLLVEFNLNLWSAGPQGKRPLRVEIATDLRDPNARGVAHGPEIGDLTTLQERMEIMMRRKGRAEYALRTTGQGQHINIFYVPAQLGLLRKRDAREVLEPAIASFGRSNDRELTVTFHDDPEWTSLLEVYPAYDPAQWARDRALLMQMAKKRDAIHARREVAHHVYFPDRDGCRAFLKEARKLRFKAEGGPRKAPAGMPGTFMLVIVRQEVSIATWHLHPVVLTVKAAAEAHGGTYGDWEAELVPSLEPPPLAPPGGFKAG